jgi:hypothetical protein
MSLFPAAAPKDRKTPNVITSPGGATILKIALLLAALSFAGCAANLHQNGHCPTPGVSPFASNCPTAEELKGR